MVLRVGGWLTAMAEDARARGARIEDFMMVSILLIRGAIAWAEERGFVLPPVLCTLQSYTLACCGVVKTQGRLLDRS